MLNLHCPLGNTEFTKFYKWSAPSNDGASLMHRGNRGQNHNSNCVTDQPTYLLTRVGARDAYASENINMFADLSDLWQRQPLQQNRESFNTGILEVSTKRERPAMYLKKHLISTHPPTHPHRPQLVLHWRDLLVEQARDMVWEKEKDADYRR